MNNKNKIVWSFIYVDKNGFLRSNSLHSSKENAIEYIRDNFGYCMRDEIDNIITHLSDNDDPSYEGDDFRMYLFDSIVI